MAPPDGEFLSDLSGDAPAGENLENDAKFLALETAAKGKAETQYGDTITAAEPPDWKETRALAEALMERTRDLRVLSHLAVAKLHLSGLPGFAEVLGQIAYYLENRWDEVHPQLDPEDDNDPTLRANALFRLQDPAAVMRPLRDLPLATTPATGPLTWRDIAVFDGVMEPEEGREKVTEAFIRGAFAKTNPERLQALREAVDLAVRAVDAIPAVFDTRAEYGSGPDFTNLSKLLGDIQKALRRFETVVVETPETEDGEAESLAAAADGGGGMVMASPAAARGGFNIRSISSVTKRDDALYLLELAATYFRTNEPSSPLPMLIDRAMRLSSMDFLDILRDLAPDGLGQAQIVTGAPQE